MRGKSNTITNKIPYIQCYQEAGMIKIENKKYSVTYKVDAPACANERYVSTLAYSGMEKILSALSGFEYRFTIRNAWISQDEFVNTINLLEDKEPIVNGFIRDYNDFLKENVGIGHNNFDSSLYLTIVTEAEVSDDALARFEELDSIIVSNFSAMYGFIAKRLTLEERLEVLYEIYHPDIDSPAFGSKVDFNGTGFSLDNMNRMKMSTKDVIAPKFYEAKERNYMQIGDKYVRMFFINSIPNRISDTLLADLLSVSSNAILSVTYQPIDADFGFKTSARLVKENTEVRNVPVRDTIEDRKQKRVERRELMINENEDAYFNKAALKLFMESSAKKQPVLLSTFIIGLFSDTLEELDRDTGLLKLSANKYAVQIKECDLLQHEAFVSALPLGSLSVDYARTFNIDRLSKVLPVNIQSLFEKKVTMLGLNEINDNFLLVDRSNYPLGMIAGMRTSGKTFALKREIVNTLMSTNDFVVIIPPAPKAYRGENGKTVYTHKKEYDNLIKMLGGDVYEPLHTDLFTCSDNYGLTSSNADFKAMFIESFMVLYSGFYKKKYTSEEMDEIYRTIRKEAEGLSSFKDYASAVNYAREHAQDFRIFLKTISNYVPSDEYPDFAKGSRVKLIKYNTPVELLLQLDYLWNVAIALKKADKNLWIFVDGIDEMIYSPAPSDYLCSLLDKCAKLKVPFTMIVQDSAKICANDVSKIEFDYIVDKCNYFKLLTLGVIERKAFIEKLNIAPPLAPFVTDREPSEGIIVTPSISAPFNDRFESENPFYQKFQN